MLSRTMFLEPWLLAASCPSLTRNVKDGAARFHCNSVSQGEREAIGCGVGCRLFSRPLLEKREKGRTPNYFG